MTADRRRAPAYPIASVENVLRVLEMLPGRDDLTLTEISRTLGVAPSTAHRLLAMLLYHDFVRQDAASKTFAPGRALLEIAMSSSGAGDLPAVARPVLQALSRDLGETVHLVELDGRMASFLDSVESPQALRVTSRAGVQMPAHCTAGGKVLLARLGEAELRDRLGPEPFERLTPHSARTFAGLRLQLRAAARLGYATNFGESEPGLAAVAVPVGQAGAAGGRDLSITVSAPSDRLGPDDAARVAAVTAAAAGRLAALLTGAGG